MVPTTAGGKLFQAGILFSTANAKGTAFSKVYSENIKAKPHTFVMKLHKVLQPKHQVRQPKHQVRQPKHHTEKILI